MLEITGSDIAALNDEDLRSLVGMLCEFEMRSRGLSTSAVTWGGNQNAADGGIDVRVRIEGSGNAPLHGFLPRPSIGFQVKKTDFTPGLIEPEMRPSGQLRASINDLIDEHGAYIIASSGSDTSYSALKDRLNAMQSAVADKAAHADLLLDFYDRNRLATWTRAHPGLAVWVCRQIGRGISGWQPYSSWSVSPDGVEDEYLLDDQARLLAGFTDERGIDVTQGINRIRDVLRGIRRVVRLAGLSGVGKTRLVQSLFDARVGNNPLDPAAVIYTDMNDNPSPQPTGMISDLIALRTRAIVVVDNCAPELHRRITELCLRSDSQISAITVEYDVQEDEPEGTEVFRLEPSSMEVVSNLIARRFPTMARLDVNRIAEFSGGNARIALALANTLERHESIASLHDEELFKRLFYQRQEHHNGLLEAAQGCALLYSFQGEALDGNDAELPKIAALVGMTAQQLYAKVAKLKQRDLVQRRSVWRAILPQAIANRLAKMALREIPLELIEHQFNTQRLMKSFSRRLGHLHESDEAKQIVTKWLAKDGWLASVGNLNDFGLAVFNNIAPVSPEATLSALERELSAPDFSGPIDEWRRDRIGTVLRSIAYEAALFDRCVATMIPLALAEPTDRSHPIRDALKGLFHIYLSGTHATIEQRTKVAEDLLRSSEPERRSIGLQLLEALLKAERFEAMHLFDFGARAHDYGYSPKTHNEVANWFVLTLRLARQVATKNDETGSAIRSLIAQSIRSLWFLGPDVQEQFELTASEITADDYWQEALIAIRFILSTSPDEADATAMKRLRTLESVLRPKNVVEQVRAVVLSPRSGVLDYADTNDDSPTAAFEKAEATAKELGQAVCREQSLFKILLPDLVKGNPARLYSFGKGVALASADHRGVWEQFTHALARTAAERQNVDAFAGFLNGLSAVDERLSEILLEEAVTHDTLGIWFPFLQSSVAVSAAGADRLKRAATLGKARPVAFHFLGWRSVLSEDDLRCILLSVAEQEKGYGTAINILTARFHSYQNEKKEVPPELIDAGRTLLSSPDFGIRDSSFDYHLHIVANVCLRGENGSNATKSLCERINQGFTDHTFRAYNYERTLQSIFELQPRIALDVFFENAPTPRGFDKNFTSFDDPSDRRMNPIDVVPTDEMIRWCDENPAKRYPTISRTVSYHSAPKEGAAEWTPLAMAMLKRAPSPVTVLEAFVDRFSPMMWSGSRAAIIESRLGLLERLGELENAEVEQYVKRIRPQIVNDIAQERKSEDERDSARDERFE